MTFEETKQALCVALLVEGLGMGDHASIPEEFTTPVWKLLSCTTPWQHVHLPETVAPLRFWLMAQHYEARPSLERRLVDYEEASEAYICEDVRYDADEDASGYHTDADGLEYGTFHMQA